MKPQLLLLLGALCPICPLAADPAPPAQPVIPAGSFSVMDYGAVADGHTSNTDAFTRAIAAVSKAGGGTLSVPAGDYFTGPFELCSRLNFRLEKGAHLLFSQNFSDYKVADKKYRPMVGATNCEDLEISGSGAFDGQGDPWWVIERRVKAEARAKGAHDAEIGRPKMIVLEGCKRVRIEGVTLENSPMFHIVPSRCEDVAIDGITIKSPWDSPNTDGIDPSVSRRVLITHCTIDTGDDCVAVKAGHTGSGPSEDILVADCTFLHGHGCSIGSDTNAGVRNMTVRNCTFDGTDLGVRLKSARGRGGLVEDITYSDLTMRNVGEAIVITSYYYDLPKVGNEDDAQPVAADTPIWRNIVIKNIVATKGTKDAGLIYGLPEMPERNITLRNVSIEAPKGLRIDNVDGVALDNVTIMPVNGTALVLGDAVKNLTH